MEARAKRNTTRALRQLAKLQPSAARVRRDNRDIDVAIAERMGVTPNTVRTHVQGILTKLQVHSRLEAVAYATSRLIVSEAS